MLFILKFLVGETLHFSFVFSFFIKKYFIGCFLDKWNILNLKKLGCQSFIIEVKYLITFAFVFTLIKDNVYLNMIK